MERTPLKSPSLSLLYGIGMLSALWEINTITNTAVTPPIMNLKRTKKVFYPGMNDADDHGPVNYENEVLERKLDTLFKEYHEMFGPQREIDIKRMTCQILLTLLPDDKKEPVYIELYALDGRDYLAEQAEKVTKEKARLEEEKKYQEAYLKRKQEWHSKQEGSNSYSYRNRGNRTWIIDDPLDV